MNVSASRANQTMRAAAPGRAGSPRSGSEATLKVGPKGIPSRLQCSGSKMLMLDPCLGSDGRPYERAVAEEKAAREPDFSVGQALPSLAQQSRAFITDLIEKNPPPADLMIMSPQGQFMLDPVWDSEGNTRDRSELPPEARAEAPRNTIAFEKVERYINKALDRALRDDVRGQVRDTTLAIIGALPSVVRAGANVLLPVVGAIPGAVLGVFGMLTMGPTSISMGAAMGAEVGHAAAWSLGRGLNAAGLGHGPLNRKCEKFEDEPLIFRLT